MEKNKAWGPRRKERERRGDCECVCVEMCGQVIVCPTVCVCVCVCACVRILSRGFFCQECVAVLLPLPLWSRAVQEGRLAGWLTAQERKRSLSNGRWRTACAYTAENTHTHTDMHACTQAHTHALLCANTVAFIRSMTQMARRKFSPSSS